MFTGEALVPSNCFAPVASPSNPITSDSSPTLGLKSIQSLRFNVPFVELLNVGIVA